MRHASFLLALGAALVSGPALPRQPQPGAEQSDAIPEQEIKLARAVARKYGDKLKDALHEATQGGGPANGIAVCHDKADQIATALSAESNMIVGRTSLKLRNPNNAPDNWELAVLKQFEARKEQGEPVEKLEFFSVIDDDQGQQTFRYMKAIPTAAPCLACHGEHIDPEVDSKLKALYPNDKARGFKEGELRGAFTIAKPLQ